MSEKNNKKSDLNIFGIIGLILLIFLIISTMRSKNTDESTIYENIENHNSTKKSEEVAIIKKEVLTKNDINEHTFKGEWAFTTENAKIFCVPPGEMTGAKVIINNKEYAITRNITDLPFLPAELWANQKTDGIGCSGAMIEGKCKISLYDMTNYADSICN